MRAAALAALLLAGAGCGSASRSPAGAVRAFEEAAREGDLERVVKLLGPRTRARLEADARAASEQAGRRTILPSELLAAGWTPPRFEPDVVREVSRAGGAAVVEVVGERGEREQVAVVREGGSWKVELP